LTQKHASVPGRRPALRSDNPPRWKPARRKGTALVTRIAAGVVAQSSRARPADAVLREVLRGERELSAVDARGVSRMVFAYFRWFGWLDRKLPLETRIESALEFDARFQKNPFTLPAENLRAKAVPAWLAGEMELNERWLRSLQREPLLWLRARKGQGKALAKKLGHARRRERDVPEALVYEGAKDLFQTEEFRAGEFEIQDIASQLVGWLCDPKPRETWWDACAGEGGKTLHLSELMENTGLIWASDRAEWRLEKLKRRAARAKVFNYRCAAWDGGADLPTKTQFDGVLVDAPCSGVGTWQRNPHARWTTTLADVRELAEVQKRLLAHVAPSVKPGGRLVYAVCTLTRAETEEVTRAFSEHQPAFEPLPLSLPASQKENGRALTSAATMTIWPQDWSGNGMFVAAWKRKQPGSV
jgi:16S rRNA (cytosine967-C5)-methyltransferase